MATTLGYTAQIQYANEAAVMEVVVLPRRILKWLQSLRLTVSVGRNIRRELSNGFVVAEILTRYGFTEHSQQPLVSSFENENSLARKLNNWVRIRAMLAAKGQDIPEKMIDATIHAKTGAAQALVQYLHCLLTGIRSSVPLKEFDYSSENPNVLPYHARHTAATAIKANIREQEYVTNPNILHRNAAIEHVITEYEHERETDRNINPYRYGRSVRSATGSNKKPTPTPPHTAASTRMNKSNKFITQRMNSSQLSTIGASPSPSKPPNLGPSRVVLKTTARLSDTLDQ